MTSKPCSNKKRVPLLCFFVVLLLLETLAVVTTVQAAAGVKTRSEKKRWRQQMREDAGRRKTPSEKQRWRAEQHEARRVQQKDDALRRFADTPLKVKQGGVRGGEQEEGVTTKQDRKRRGDALATKTVSEKQKWKDARKKKQQAWTQDKKLESLSPSEKKKKRAARKEALQAKRLKNKRLREERQAAAEL